MNRTKFYLFLIFLLVGFCGAVNRLHAQNIPANLNVDNLSDDEIRQYMAQAKAAGLTDDQLVQMALNKGVSTLQVQHLQARITDIRSKDSNNGGGSSPGNDGVSQGRQYVDQGAVNKSNNFEPSANALKIFGSDLFRNGPSNNFEPNLNIPTPINYIVGARDQLLITVYGKSVANWSLVVSPDGNINIPGIGIVNVAGKTIEQDTRLIETKLAANNYAIDRGTSVNISLGNIRSIKVTIQGQVVKPGTFTLPSLSTVFSALSVAGGPNDIGSYRDIEVLRSNHVVAHLDLYDFIVKGIQKENIGLRDQDVIRVPTYDKRVELTGQVKIPGLFEVLSTETLHDLINFSGGFTDRAFTGRIKVIGVRNGQLAFSDVFEKDYNSYVPHRGDRYIIDSILNRYENRVSLRGAVFRPSDYELTNGLTLSKLIKNAGGLKEDAFTGRGSILRLNPDNTREQLSFNVADVVQGKPGSDVTLQREDIVNISSIFDLRDSYKVTINGEVRNPGDFSYADSMKVADLIIRAGGFAEGASSKRIQVARRVYDADPHVRNSKVANVYTVDINGAPKVGEGDFTLKPYDIVSVYSSPGFEKQRIVKVEGEVLYPGNYPIKTKDEKISDLIADAGGLIPSADVEGGTLKRSNKAILGVDKNNKIDTAELEREHWDRLQRLKKSAKDSTASSQDSIPRNDFVGIDLKKILQNPGSNIDLIVEDGDVIRIPKRQQLVRVNGEVLYPSAVVYDNSKSFNEYVLNAGGYSSDALKKRAYVVYPNGTVKGTRKFLFFNSHPRIKPGSEIFVPKKAARNPVNAAEILGFATGLASLGAIILGILSLNK